MIVRFVIWRQWVLRDYNLCKILSAKAMKLVWMLIWFIFSVIWLCFILFYLGDVLFVPLNYLEGGEYIVIAKPVWVWNWILDFLWNAIAFLLSKLLTRCNMDHFSTNLWHLSFNEEKLLTDDEILGSGMIHVVSTMRLSIGAVCVVLSLGIASSSRSLCQLRCLIRLHFG